MSRGRTCRELGITCISVAHRSSALGFHDDVLVLHADGTWTIRPVTNDDDDLLAVANEGNTPRIEGGSGAGDAQDDRDGGVLPADAAANVGERDNDSATQ